MADVTLPANFAWVIFAFLLSAILVLGLGVNVGRARKKYGIKYPRMYADASDGEDGLYFNCVQRVHQNTLEGFPTFVFLMIFAGIRFPVSEFPL